VYCAACQTHGSLYLVMELVTGGELFDNLIQDGAFPECVRAPSARTHARERERGREFVWARGGMPCI
jgi:serine/threonine protein kinase